jgi:hypothetical protein
MAPLIWKVYSATGEHIGSLDEAQDAAAVVGRRGVGATVRDEFDDIVWREGSEAQSALDSFDFAADVMERRFRATEQVRSVDPDHPVDLS